MDHLERAKRVPANQTKERLAALESAIGILRAAGVKDPFPLYPGHVEHRFNLLRGGGLVAVSGSTLEKAWQRGSTFSSGLSDSEIAATAFKVQITDSYYQALKAVAYDAAQNKETTRHMQFPAWVGVLIRQRPGLDYETYDFKSPARAMDDDTFANYETHIWFNSETPECPLDVVRMYITPADTFFKPHPDYPDLIAGNKYTYDENNNRPNEVNLWLKCGGGLINRLQIAIPGNMIGLVRKLALADDPGSSFATFMKQCFIVPTDENNEESEVIRVGRTKITAKFWPELSMNLSQYVWLKNRSRTTLLSQFNFTSLEQGLTRGYRSARNRTTQTRLGLTEPTSLKLEEFGNLIDYILHLIPGPRS